MEATKCTILKQGVIHTRTKEATYAMNITTLLCDFVDYFSLIFNFRSVVISAFEKSSTSNNPHAREYTYIYAAHYIVIYIFLIEIIIAYVMSDYLMRESFISGMNQTIDFVCVKRKLFAFDEAANKIFECTLSIMVYLRCNVNVATFN